MYGEQDKEKEPTKLKRDAKMEVYKSGLFTREELGILSNIDSGVNEDHSDSNFPWGVHYHMQLYIVERYMREKNGEKEIKVEDNSVELRKQDEKIREELDKRKFGVMNIDGEEVSVFDYIKENKNES